MANTSWSPSSTNAVASRNDTVVARAANQPRPRAAAARTRAAPSKLKRGARITAEDRRLLSLDRDGGNRNVRQIEIGVGIGSEKSQARSSVVEHYLDTVGVGGSIPPVPTSTDGNPGRVPKPSRDELRRAKLAFAHAIDGNPATVSTPSRDELRRAKLAFAHAIDGNPATVSTPSRDELRRAKLAFAHAIDGNPRPSIGGSPLPSIDGCDFVAVWSGAGLGLAAMLFA